MEKRNKKVLKLIYISLLVMVISAFSSCSADKTPDYDGNALAYIIFSADSSRDLTINYNPKSYSSLYWFYKAEKVDEYGTVGESKEWTPIITSLTDGNPTTGLGVDYIGPFSQGKWSFSLIAYRETSEATTEGAVSYTYSYTTTNSDGNNEPTKKTFYFATPIYESEAISETLEKEKETVAATVDSVNGDGTLTLSSLSFTATSGLTSASMALTRQDTAENLSSKQLTISEEEGKYSVTDITYSNIPNGTYECKVQATGEGDESFTSTFYFSIYTGTTTTLSGELAEDKE